MMLLLARMSLFLAGFALAATGAAAQEAAPASADAPATVTSALAALTESCSAHKFETLVKTVTTEGRTRGSRVKICGKEGQTDADWLVTLRDSVRKTESNPELAPAVRTQIVTAIAAEITRLEEAASARTMTSPTATIAVSNQPVSVPEAPPLYSSVPPLPAPLPRAATIAAGSNPVSAGPRLTIRCALPREAFTACRRLERETQLSIRAEEDLADGFSLRFVRDGEPRADLALGALQNEGSLRIRLPARVCSGVFRGKVQVQVVSRGQVVDTLGPFALSCRP